MFDVALDGGGYLRNAAASAPSPSPPRSPSQLAAHPCASAAAANDFAFSETRSGWQLAYGEAGDCYPTASCPQAQFKINLTGTGFVVSPRTKWKAEGNNVTKQVHRLKVLLH